ncbi:MAG: type I methionyl aminopeptidase [Myxococcales bacterium]|nr:type I methionyl aminopeptidase [Myxococcales bacterium]MDH5307069.1 type I methionyl aminopeptidase [Myxococcales bacterium]MDH5565884.1 type I methionyl aminopeptidase [Myxococcales bacterium]
MGRGQRIEIRTPDEIEAMRDAARHVAEILIELRERVAPGVTTRELDEYAEKAIAQRGVRSSFKGYDPLGLPAYPAVLCVSVNDEIVHGIPGSRELVEGDIVSLDFGVECDGFHGDSAVTVSVGRIGEETQRLLDTSSQALDEAMEVMVPGRRLSDIGHAVQRCVEAAGYSVVREFAGHGIGRKLHEPPWIPNFGAAGRGPRLVPGMVFAIEPMVTIGRSDVKMRDDEWTAVTADGSLAAHYEHTVLITEDGPEALTRVAGSH